MTHSLDTSRVIAIVGMAGRFPGAHNTAEFWRNLCAGLETVSVFDASELDPSLDPALVKDPHYVPAKGIVPDADLFDAAFFGYSPREAEIIDPQQRFFLECAWEALEDAGYDSESYAGAIGVYGGASMNSYMSANLLANPDVVATVGSYQLMVSNDKDYLPTRVSYKLNLKGPSVNIQTACSTSLVAVHIACQSLLDYQCDMALAGVMSITFPHKSGYLFQEGMILSPDGHCRTFDAAAHGIVNGEGGGIVVLKRLDDALSNGDHIHAVIRGTSINNDGGLKIGYTAPSVDGQMDVIATAQAVAGVTPDTITFVEAHGTGTVLGDPIEVSALTQVFRAGTDKKGYCALGAVKSNVGHLDAAAGMAGLIKTVLALEHAKLPPTLHLKTLNPKLDLPNSPFYVNTTLQEWETGDLPRRAGVSAFGIGGTNSHVVLEQAPPLPAGKCLRDWHLVPISAKTTTALEQATDNVVEHLSQNPQLELGDVAYTLQVGRRAFNHRRVVVGYDGTDVTRALAARDVKRVRTGVVDGHRRSVAYMFSGQGAQYAGMAEDLYASEQVVREAVDQCADILRPMLGIDLRDVLYADRRPAIAANSVAPGFERDLRQTWLAQPALFVVEYAMARLWMQWGLVPSAMIGHSIGELVAACLAGVFSLTDGLNLVAARGRLMQALPKGVMLVVALPEADVRPLLSPGIALAAVNAPKLCVVSGAEMPLQALQDRLAAQKVFTRRLVTSHAFHSEMMDAVLPPFAERVRRVPLCPPAIPFISNVTGTWITNAEATDPAYWVRHLRQTVRFADGVRELLQDPDRILLEVGPGQTLSTLARQQLAKPGERLILSSLHHPEDTANDTAFALDTLGQMWLAGAEIDWARVHAGETLKRVPLPTYPFERQRFWIEPRKHSPAPEPAAIPSVPIKKPDMADWFRVPAWKRTPQPQAAPTGGGTLCWWLLVDEWGLGSKVAAQLEGEGHTVIIVRGGTGFERQADGEYTIERHTPADYDTLVRELTAAGHVPDRILHLWNVAPVDKTDDRIASIAEAENAALYSLLYLVQALGNHTVTSAIRMAVITNNMQEVTGGDLQCPEKAAALGPVLDIPEEYPNIACQCIDVELNDGPSGRGVDLVRQILTELEGATTDRIVAYRKRFRWARILEPLRIEASAAGASPFKPGGVYLITGGLGGIGLTLAEQIAREVPAKLALVSRRGLPPCDEWDRRVADDGAEDSTRRAILKVRELERLGAQVLVAAVDVSDPVEMERLIARVRSELGEIRGVIHAAGISGGGVAQLRTADQVANVLRPKIRGTLVLERVLGSAPLDFLVLCSSLNALWGVAGFMDYAAASAFLDAYALYCNANRGGRCYSINWDLWQEVGMAVDAQVPPDLERAKQERLRDGIRPEEGIEAMARILRQPAGQIAVFCRDESAYLAEPPAVSRPAARPAGAMAEHVPAGSAVDAPAAHARPDLTSAFALPRSPLEQTLAAIWQDLLGIEQVGINDNFFELGGHSLMATLVLSRLRDAFQIELPLRSLFEATTIAELAPLIETVQWANKDHHDLPDDQDREEMEL